MSWTTDYPTKAGFYWIRNYRIRVWSDPGPDIVRVIRVEESGKSDAFEFCFTGRDNRYSQAVLTHAEWQGPIEPEAEKPNRVEFKSLPLAACRACGKATNMFISWPTRVAIGPHAHRHYSPICRECWIAVLTPEQREAYKV